MPDLLSKVVPGEVSPRARFGNFDIINDVDGNPLSLGKGTFGRTYKASHRFLDTVVALKIINERYASDVGVRQRFLVEARAVARLSHPHIARLYDFGEVDGVLHYAMEYCGGGSLADYVTRQGALPVRNAVEVGQQIAGALKCAHTAGFIHRDLKPSNIMLTEDQQSLFTKLIDFGLVQPSLPAATKSFTDQSVEGARFLGTPLFASPEQLREEAIDVRTDLFSLGMTLWFLVIGQAPEGGSSAEIAASRLSSASYALQLPSSLPQVLRDLLARLLEKDRKNRFQTAADVFAAFNACAVSLGFRRARDYTDPTAELWQEDLAESSASAPPQEVVEPLEVESVERELTDEYTIVTRANEDFTGVNYVAASQERPNDFFLLHVLHPPAVEDTALFGRLRTHLAALIKLDRPEVLRPQSIRSYSDYAAIIAAKPDGEDLMSVLRTERVVSLVDAAPLLETIAQTCDALASAGLPGVQLAPARIILHWPVTDGAAGRSRITSARPILYPRFLAVSEAPELVRLNEPEDVSSTMTTDMLGDPTRSDNISEHFATLLYRIVAGRNCPVAASLSSQAYIPVPGLSEQSNRLLSLVIAKQIERNSCAQILREIFSAEGIAQRVPGHPTAGFTAGSSGSTIAPPTGTPVKAASPPTSTPETKTRPLTRRPLRPLMPTGATPPVLAREIPPQPQTRPPSETPAEIKPAAIIPPVPERQVPARVEQAETKVVEKPKEAVAEIVEAKQTEPPALTEEQRAEVSPLLLSPKSSGLGEGDPTHVITPPPLPAVTEARAAVEEKPGVLPAADESPVRPDATKSSSGKIEPIAAARTGASRHDKRAKKRKDADKVAQASPAPLTPVIAPTVVEAPKRPVAPEPQADATPATSSGEAEIPGVYRQTSVTLPTAPRTTAAALRWYQENRRVVQLGAAALLLLTIIIPVTIKLRPSRTVTTGKNASSTPALQPSATPAAKSPNVATPTATITFAKASPPSVKPSPPPVATPELSPPSLAVASPAAVVPEASALPSVIASPSVTQQVRTQVSGRYVGVVYNRNASGDSTLEVERELSLNTDAGEGYVIDYRADPANPVRLSNGRTGANGAYIAEATFPPTSDLGKETVTATPNDEGTIAVNFAGQLSNGTPYVLGGVLRPWTEQDNTHYQGLLAARASTDKTPAGTTLPTGIHMGNPVPPEIEHKSGKTVMKSEPSKQGSRSRASAGAERPAPRTQAPAPVRAAPPRTNPQPASNRHADPFQGTNPGG